MVKSKKREKQTKRWEIKEKRKIDWLSIIVIILIILLIIFLIKQQYLG